MGGSAGMSCYSARRVVAILGAAALVVVALPGVSRAAEPNKPALVGPAAGATTADTSPTLGVTATDPDGGDLTVRFEGRVKGATVAGGGAGEKFSVVVLPDTQNYTYNNRQGTITAQSRWAVANRSALNIAFVAQVGDLVSNSDQPAQWANVSNGLTPLDEAGIPTSVVPGNHDFDNITGAVGLYDTYFPVSRYANATWTPGTARYGGYYGQHQFGPDAADRRNMNNYALFSAGGTDFLMLNLEWEAPAGALEWADRVLKAHPNRTVVLTTHSFVSISGGLRTTAQRPGGTPPATLWSSFVATHCQIKLVLSGHEHLGDLGEARRTDTNSCGQPVQAILTDYQDRANGGDGWLRYYTFDPAAGSMTATTYSPTLGQFETDADSSFTVPFALATQVPAPFATIGTVTVASGATASLPWTGLVDDTSYEWRAVVDDGTATTSGDTWTLRTPPKAQVVTDTFRRTAGAGWGAADSGQRWASSAASAFAVDGEWGTITVPKGGGRAIRPADVLLGDAVVEADLRTTSSPSGSGTYFWLIGREAGALSYRAKLTLTATGVTTLSLTRNNNGTDTTLATTRVPGTVPAGTTLRLRFEQSGTAPTSLRASAWPAAGSEPAAWMLTTTDAAAALQNPGGFGIDSYVSSGATAGQTIQVDRYSIIRPGAAAPPPPPPVNLAPTATIGTSVVNGRAVTVDGGGSADPDGTVTAWRWTFGDGATAEGRSATHTYATDGTFPITLTVTDDDGATGSATAGVTVAAPPPPPPAADAVRDGFARTAAGSWGAADTGGSWTVQGAAARYSVADGAGRHVLTTAGSSAESALGAVAVTGSDTRVRIAWSRTAAAGTLYATVIPRAVSASADYRVKVVVGANGRPTLYPIKRVGGVETNLAMISLPVTVAADSSYSLAIRLAASGASTVVSAKLWPTGAAEPADWQISATDATASLQGPGSVKVNSYLSSGATAPVTTSFDDLVVTRR